MTRGVIPFSAALLATALAHAPAAAQEKTESRSGPEEVAPDVHLDSDLGTVMFDLRALRRKGCLDATDIGPQKQTLADADKAGGELTYLRARLHTGTGPDDYARFNDLLDKIAQLNFLRQQVYALKACGSEAE